MKILKILIFSYVGWLFFWMAIVFATAGAGAMRMIVFPPIAIYFVYDNAAFLWVPLLCAAILSIVFGIAINRVSSNFEAKIFLTTGCFLVAFLASGELYLEQRIRQSLPVPTPDCVIEQSFLHALGRQRDAYRHSVFAHDGSVYRWSYSLNGFYKSPTALFVLDCTPEHRHKYWDSFRDRSRPINDVQEGVRYE